MEIGTSVTTRYFGGYERVEVVGIETDHYVVLRFGGQAMDCLPKDQIEKVLKKAPSAIHH